MIYKCLIRIFSGQKACILVALSLFICLLQVWSVPLYAADSIDFNKPVSLTISYQYKNKALTNASFEIYLVAVTDENGELTVTEAFEEYDVNIRGKNDEAWKKLTKELETEVTQYTVGNITPTASGTTDINGVLVFPEKGKDLMHGLYLVKGTVHTQDGYRYTTEPFLVLLPTQDKVENTWVYQVTAGPKSAEDKIENPSPTPTPTPSKPPTPEGPKLPQTGQIWWPVPVLFALGILLVVIGLLRRKGKEYEQ